ncbi:hypothetical protein BDV93DRAFT_545750 [Ceratobasidium sp. AG-I]|nr:hypothetical protein BDV93DRAFT_545750 [Ceratobasidium sp. AG-I]
MSASTSCLPSELLSHIFLVLTRSWLYSRSVGDESDGQITYPIILSSVCVRWRQVAISTPSLWSHIYFNPALHTPNGLSLAKLYLERSANLPLSVCIGRYGDGPSLYTENQELASLIHLFATRLESLSMIQDYSTFFNDMFMILLEGSAGQIRKFALDDGYLVADSLLPQEAICQLLEPLNTLYLDEFDLEWSTIPCRNLVELQLISPHPDMSPTGTQLAQFLNANPAIRRLKLAKFQLVSYENDIPPIVLPEVRTVALEASPQFMSWLLALLVPGSHELDLQFQILSVSSTRQTQATEACRRFFQRARVISFHSMGNSGISFSSIATDLLHLETLQISDLHSSGHHDFSEIHAQTRLPPKLHTIEFTRAALGNFVCTVLLAYDATLSEDSRRETRPFNEGAMFLMVECAYTQLQVSGAFAQSKTLIRPPSLALKVSKLRVEIHQMPKETIKRDYVPTTTAHPDTKVSSTETNRVRALWMVLKICAGESLAKTISDSLQSATPENLRAVRETSGPLFAEASRPLNCHKHPDGICFKILHIRDPKEVEDRNGDKEDKRVGFRLSGTNAVVTCRIDSFKLTQTPEIVPVVLKKHSSMPKEVKKRSRVASGGPSAPKPREPRAVESEDVKALRKLFKQSTPDAIATTLSNSFKDAAPEHLQALRALLVPLSLSASNPLHCVRCHETYVQSGNNKNACVIMCDDDGDFERDYHNGSEGYYTTSCCGRTFDEDDVEAGTCLSTSHTTNPHEVSYREGEEEDVEEGLNLGGSRMIYTCRINGCKTVRKPARKPARK